MKTSRIEIGFVDPPTRDQIYIISETSDKGNTLFKNLHGEITIEVMDDSRITKLPPRKDCLVVLTIPDIDRQFWLGYVAGMRLGVNIGSCNKE